MVGQPAGWHGRARRALTVGAAICLLAATLALGACGAAAQASNHAASSGSASVGSIPGGGMAVRPCPGEVGDATQVGSLALTLTQSDAAGSLHVGEQAQVRLPASLHWTLTSQPALLSSVGIAGGQDTTLNICYWSFRAQSAGSATLRFTGVPPCDNPGSCDSVTTEQDFTITVS
jgi:hypothetical protein